MNDGQEIGPAWRRALGWGFGDSTPNAFTLTLGLPNLRALPLDTFAKAIVDYYSAQGRKELPWQHPRTPYRVWVSEIMLQQTQVARMIVYFNRFVSRFPDVASLAAATSDEVMAHWSGLGYYARARNLHKSAGMLVERHNGELPDDLESLLALPGIGRSTAGAIRSSAFGIPTPILDANVRRVLSRFHGIRGVTGESATEKTLWQYAEAHTPNTRIQEYTQGIMDFGARLCRMSRPACDRCPLAVDCRALAEGAVEEFPVPRKRRAKPLRRVCFFLVTDLQGRVLLELRPESGVWGGLWTFPEREVNSETGDFVSELKRTLASSHSLADAEVRELAAPAKFRHHFTHFDLEIHPIRLVIDRYFSGRDGPWRWVRPAECENLGMPSAAKRLLADIWA